MIIYSNTVSLPFFIIKYLYRDPPIMWRHHEISSRSRHDVTHIPADREPRHQASWCATKPSFIIHHPSSFAVNCNWNIIPKQSIIVGRWVQQSKRKVSPIMRTKGLYGKSLTWGKVKNQSGKLQVVDCVETDSRHPLWMLMLPFWFSFSTWSVWNL